MNDAPRVGRLNTVSSVRRELARVYREAREKRLPVEEAKVLNEVLSNIGQMIQVRNRREPSFEEGLTEVAAT